MLAALILLFGATLSDAPSRAQPKPTRGAVRRAFEVASGALVELQGTHGHQLGVVVGSHGEILSGAHGDRDEAQVAWRGERLLAQVQSRQPELGVALWTLKSGGPSIPTAVHPGVPLEPGKEGWAIALERGKDGKTQPRLGRLHGGDSPDYVLLDLRVPPQTPVLDLQGRLLGWSVNRSPRGVRLISIPALRAQLALETR